MLTLPLLKPVPCPRPQPLCPGPAPHYTFVIYCAAVGPYFKTGQLTPIDLIVETQFHRAAPGGMGGTKCAGELWQLVMHNVPQLSQGVPAHTPCCGHPSQQLGHTASACGK